MTKLTDHQLCFMSDRDLENFNFLKLDNSYVGPDDDDEAGFEFEVKKNQEEEEDFKIHPGFKVSIFVLFL